MIPQINTIRIPPDFCQYASGACDQDFKGTQVSRGIFLYPSEPEPIAATIEKGADILRQYGGAGHWHTWKEFRSTGQIIFCSICKSMRFSECVVADVTTLNFNLLFEIGFALGLGLPVIPIRDTTFIRDKREFEELGMLDVIGYVDFQNSSGLAASLQKRLPVSSIPCPPVSINLAASLYVVKSQIDTEGAVRMMSSLKKSTIRFRSYDASERRRARRAWQAVQRQARARADWLPPVSNPEWRAQDNSPRDGRDWAAAGWVIKAAAGAVVSFHPDKRTFKSAGVLGVWS